MGKVCPAITMDAELDFIALCDRIVICSAEPSSYADATGTVDLATHTMATGDFAIAADVNGRKLTIAAQAGVVIQHSGDATHVALCLSSDTSLRYVTTCTLQNLTAGGGATVDIPAWKINMTVPTQEF